MIRARTRESGAPQEHDAELVRRVATGDLGALGALYDRHARAVLSFVRRVTPREDAEDVVQITFLRVVSAATAFDASAASAKPWLFGIAFHVVLERRRSHRRLAAFVRDLGERPLAPAEIFTSRPDLTRALARLPESKRVVLLLAEVEEFTGPEIATTLGIPVGTVWTRLHHARRELRRCFEEA